MDSHSRSASPGAPARPQHRPPSPPSPPPLTPGLDNQAFQPDDPNHNDSFASNHTHQNGHNKELNGDTKTLEAVNLELINLQPRNGNTKKKDIEVDMNVTNPYDEYFVPVNEHRKYMRGEKLYVTADKRGEKGGCKRPLCWALLGLAAAVVVALIALAATGVLFTNSPTPVEQYNSSVSSARALGGIGQASHRDHDHRDHDHSHHHDHHDDHNDEHQLFGNGQDETTHDENYDQTDGDNSYDTSMYVPKVMEGELKLENEDFPTALFDPGSNDYKQFTQALKEAIYGMDGMDMNGKDLVVELLQPRKETGTVRYRVHWRSTLNNNPNNMLRPNDLKADLEKYLVRHNRMINLYEVAKDGITARRVLDLCQINKNNCEYGCEFDESILDFTCTCPQSQMLDITDPRRCIPTAEPSVIDDKSSNDFANFDSEKTTTKMDFENNMHNTSHSDNNVYDWKETNTVMLETTTDTDADLKFSHIFGHENNAEDERKPENIDTSKLFIQHPEPSSEPEPEPTSEPEPSSEPLSVRSPDPSPKSSSEPSSEPTPEPSADLSPKLSSEPSPEPTTDPSPEPFSKSLHEHFSEPESELPKESETESFAETATKQYMELSTKLWLEPEPEPTSEPEPESTSELATKTKFEMESQPSPEPEPQSQPSSDPAANLSEAEPTSEPNSVVQLESSSEPSSTAGVSELYPMSLDSKKKPAHELSTTPEPVSVTKPKITIKIDMGKRSEATKEHTTETAHIPDVTTDSVAVFDPITELDHVVKQKLGTKSDQQAKTVTKAPLQILNYNPTDESALSPHHETATKEIIEERPTKSQAELILENSTGNNFEKESVTETTKYGDSNVSDESTDVTNVILSSINNSKEVKTIDNVKNGDITTEAIFKTNSEGLSEGILELNKPQSIEQHFISSNGDDDWLQDDKNKTTKESNNLKNIQITELSPPDHPKATEDVLSFEFIAKNNEVPSETDDDETKSKSTPTVQADGDKEQTSLNHIYSRSDGKNGIETQVAQLDHPVTESLNTGSSQIKHAEIIEHEHLIESLNNKTVHATKVNGEKQVNEPSEPSDISFDFINSLINRSSKSFVEQNNTDTEHVSSKTTIEVSTTANDSDWVPVSVTEINYGIMFSQSPEETETTTFNEFDDIMNPGMANVDFEPDYLSTMDKTTTKVPEHYVPMYISHDYNNEELRVKRVNTDSINNAVLIVNTTETSKASEVMETTTITQHIYKTTEESYVSNNINVTTTPKDINKTEPAPVWEVFDNDMHLVNSESIESSTVHVINQTRMNVSSESISDNTTVNNFNVTIYEISALNNNSFPMTKHINPHSSEYDDHETEMNPFLPEIENNKSLVKKLQEGHDLEPTNLNEKPNENIDDHSIPTERQTNGKSSIKPEIMLADDQNIHPNSRSVLDVTNKTKSGSQSDDIQPILTFLIDTDDLDKEHTTAPSPIMAKKILEHDASSPASVIEKTTLSTIINADVKNNMQFLSVVPLHNPDTVTKVPENFKSDNILEFNDIRTLDLTK